jgi:hypothetical protein
MQAAHRAACCGAMRKSSRRTPVLPNPCFTVPPSFHPVRIQFCFCRRCSSTYYLPNLH